MGGRRQRDDPSLQWHLVGRGGERDNARTPWSVGELRVERVGGRRGRDDPPFQRCLLVHRPERHYCGSERYLGKLGVERVGGGGGWDNPAVRWNQLADSADWREISSF